MATLRPSVVVTGLTVGAMTLVSLLAVQAEGTAPWAAAKPVPGPPATVPSAAPSPTAPALPADSGTGPRVVYSLGAQQVWLVDPATPTPVRASFPVTPGTVDPPAGEYTVYSRTEAGTGTDGKRVEHVLLFARRNGTVFGFSATLDGSTAAPDTRIRTGGIRTDQADEQLLWEFAPDGTRIVVVP